jgi:hypothetical protein
MAGGSHQPQERSAARFQQALPKRNMDGTEAQ